MAEIIGRVQRLGKQNRNRLENNTNPSSAHSTPSYCYQNFNENTDITSKIFLTAETHSIITFALDDKPDFVIQN